MNKKNYQPEHQNPARLVVGVCLFGTKTIGLDKAGWVENAGFVTGMGDG
jgi:hypothetical protein